MVKYSILLLARQSGRRRKAICNENMCGVRLCFQIYVYDESLSVVQETNNIVVFWSKQLINVCLFIALSNTP